MPPRTYSMVVIINRVAGNTKMSFGQRTWLRLKGESLSKPEDYVTYVECERRGDEVPFTFVAYGYTARQAQNYLLPGNTVVITYIPFSNEDEYQGEITGMSDITDQEMERE